MFSDRLYGINQITKIKLININMPITIVDVFLSIPIIIFLQFNLVNYQGYKGPLHKKLSHTKIGVRLMIKQKKLNNY